MILPLGRYFYPLLCAWCWWVCICGNFTKLKCHSLLMISGAKLLWAGFSRGGLESVSTKKTPPLFTTGTKQQQSLDVYLHTHICTCTHFSSAVYFPSVISQMTFPKYPYEMPGNPNGGKNSQPFTTAFKCKSSWKLPRGKWSWGTHWDTWQKSKPTHCKELQTKTGLKTSAPPVTSCHINHC